jgi:hypothetical protein
MATKSTAAAAVVAEEEEEEEAAEKARLLNHTGMPSNRIRGMLLPTDDFNSSMQTHPNPKLNTQTKSISNSNISSKATRGTIRVVVGGNNVQYIASSQPSHSIRDTPINDPEENVEQKSWQFKFKLKKSLYGSFELPNLFWWEKILLLIDFLQIFGIIWNAANAWPWPYLWIVWTRFINYINIDIFSMRDGGALAGESQNLYISKWGSVDGYGYYVLYFAVAQFVLSILVVLLEPWFSAYGKKNNVYKPRIVASILIVMYLLYVPVSLAVIR